MVNNVMKDSFSLKKKEYEKAYEELQKKYSRISALRVLSFLLGFAFLMIGIADKVFLAGICGGLFLLFFVCLVKKHSDVVEATEDVASKIIVTDRYEKRFLGEWRLFEEDGEEFLTLEDTLAKDLDLLGKNSLYQMISLAHTSKGKELLAKNLKLSDFSSLEIEKRYEAIKELSSNVELLIDFESAGIRLEKQKKKSDTIAFEEACQENKGSFLPRWANVIRILLPVLELGLIAMWGLGILHYGFPLLGFVAILSISWLTKTVTDRVILPLFSINYGINEYLKMLEIVNRYDYDSEYLSDIKKKIAGEEGILSGFKSLRRISQAYNISFNPLIHQVMSGLFLWDYQLAHCMDRWKRNYGDRVADIFDLLGEAEELMSLSVIPIVRQTGKPCISFEEKQAIKIHAEDLYHPLIDPEQVQENSVDIDSGITIITGSNMSGKTTFLRTLAMNLVLAYMGAPICGQKLESGYMKIFTSMRVTDDVANGISTFYAEILRIKAMAEYKEKNKPMICFIDEIFKGTNSADRIVGAREAISKLAGKNSITLVSTHDFELCNINDKDGRHAVNYHFQEYYEEGKLKFDYKIREGRCTTTNARELLKMAGF